MFSQIPTPAPGSIENWLLPAAALASMALVVKQLFFRHQSKAGRPVPASPPHDLVTRSEFHQALDALRDKLDARFLEVAERLQSLSDQLARIEACVARLDERTKR